MQQDLLWMYQALDLARLAQDQGEVPIGACVVLEGICVGTGYNQTISSINPCGHAEVIALAQAAKNLHNHRLIGSTLFVTLEPCLMCIGAIVQARVARVVYGACNTRIGLLSQNKLTELLKQTNHSFTITSGILEEESAKLLKRFFQEKREKN